MADLIDRQSLLEELEWLHGVVNPTNKPSVAELIERVKEQPTVAKRGEWIEPTVEWVDDVKFVLAKCSVCGNRAVMDMEQLNDTIKFARNFCGHCGARMRGERK